MRREADFVARDIVVGHGLSLTIQPKVSNIVLTKRRGGGHEEGG